jgi:hypothetical protein
MKTLSIVVGLVLAVSASIGFAQAEKVKGKAKELKRNIEAGQTNAPGKTNAPVKGR